MNHRHSITAALLAMTLFAASTGAQAADHGHPRVAGLGDWIAAQGNVALAELQDELRENLRRTLQPLLPEAPADGNFRKVSNDQPKPAADDIAI